MSGSSSSSIQKVAQIVRPQIEKPEWLENFLQRTFFDHCIAHERSKNRYNHYCITCDTSACQYCILSGMHGKHDIIQLYRHVRQNAVRITVMQKYFSCSMIQPYTCNKHKVVTLIPLPNKGPDGNASCEACGRRLKDEVYNYCSILCKIQTHSPAFSDTEPVQPDIQTSSSEDEEEQPANQDVEAERTRKRKGVPHRAPLK